MRLHNLIGTALLAAVWTFTTNHPGMAAENPSKPDWILLALSKGAHTISLVDPTTLKVLSTAPVGEDPHEVVASTDGKRAYVSNYGSGQFHNLNVIDLENSKALTDVETSGLLGPHGLQFINGKLWFTAEGAKAVARLDPATGRFDRVIGTGQDRTHMLQTSADENTVYTSNVNSGTISILTFEKSAPPKDPKTGRAYPGMMTHMEWAETVIPVGKGSEGFDISPDKKELWTAVASNGKIAVIDLDQQKVATAFDAGVEGANRLKFTPDGKRVLVSSIETGDLVILDANTHKEIKRLNLGKGCAGILITPDGKRAFVGCTADDYVAVINLDDYSIEGHINVGPRPDGLAIAKR
jgi:DNA-binding beta-propeller fold protein YncE